MSLRSLFPFAILGAIMLVGCTTTPSPAPAGPAPAPPTGGTTQPAAPQTAGVPTKPAVVAPATIKGSEESSTLLDSFTAFIVAVDGKPVAAGRKGWNQPISLAPGSHQLTVEFNRGVFLARTDLKLAAQSGAAYEVRHASDAQVYGQHTYCEFWIVDLATGEKAVPSRRTGLSTVKAHD